MLVEVVGNQRAFLRELKVLVTLIPICKTTRRWRSRQRFAVTKGSVQRTSSRGQGLQSSFLLKYLVNQLPFQHQYVVRPREDTGHAQQTQ